MKETPKPKERLHKIHNALILYGLVDTETFEQPVLLFVLPKKLIYTTHPLNIIIEYF